jgi:hypothetical protein
MRQSQCPPLSRQLLRTCRAIGAHGSSETVGKIEPRNRKRRNHQPESEILFQERISRRAAGAAKRPRKTNHVADFGSDGAKL